MQIHITSLDMVKTYHDLKLTHIISIGRPDQFPNFSSFLGQDIVIHRFSFDDLGHDDVPQPAPAVVPSRKAVRHMIDVLKTLKGDDINVLFHCTAGISRSPAAAFIFLIIRGYSYEDAYKEVMKVRGYTNPNLLMIKYADEALNQKGRMIKFTAMAFGHPEYLIRMSPMLESS